MSGMCTENVVKALHCLIYVDFSTWWEFITCILSWGNGIINENFQSYGQKAKVLQRIILYTSLLLRLLLFASGVRRCEDADFVYVQLPQILWKLAYEASMIRLLSSDKWRVSRIIAIPQASIPVGHCFFLIVLTGPPTP